MAAVDSTSTSPGVVDPHAWAEATSRELLAVQAQNRKLTVEQRAELVEQHLRERVSSVADSRRRECLQALALLFPLRDISSATHSNSTAVTPESWVAALDSVKDHMTPELKKELLDRLQAAGLLPERGGARTAGIPMPNAVQPMLPKQDLNPAMVSQMLDVMFEALWRLDDSFRAAWKGVAGFGNVDHQLPAESFKETMAKFLTGDKDVPWRMMKDRIEWTTVLAPAALVALMPACDAVEEELRTIMPEEIKKRAEVTFFNKEVAWWKEYETSIRKLHFEALKKAFCSRIIDRARVLARLQGGQAAQVRTN